jgi:hypothetical protein
MKVSIMEHKIKPPAKVSNAANKKPTSTADKKIVATKVGEKPKTTKTPQKASTTRPAAKLSLASKVVKIKPDAPANKTAPKKVATTMTPAIPLGKAVKGEKKKKKMVRDSFNMPESDYAYIAALKKRCIKAGKSAKKSEVLRAALKCLAGLSDTALVKAIADLEPIKTGRPAKR